MKLTIESQIMTTSVIVVLSIEQVTKGCFYTQKGVSKQAMLQFKNLFFQASFLK